MTEKELIDKRRKEFFNEHAERWLDMWYSDPDTGTYTRHAKELVRLFNLLDLKAGESVLDIGCGSGILVPLILERIGPGGKLHEVDYAEKMIEVNRSLHNDPRIEFIVSSADKVDIPGGSFDTAICFACFPHFEDKQGTLKNINRMLRPGGKLAISHCNSSEEINNHHRKHECVMNDHLPTSEKMSEMISLAGFEIKQFIDEPGFYLVMAQKNDKKT